MSVCVFVCVNWKLCMSLSSIDDGRVWWVWIQGVVASSNLRRVLMYRLIWKSIYVAKSCIVGGRGCG